MRNTTAFAASLIALFLLFACSSSDDNASTATASTTVPEVYKKIYGASSITSDGTYINPLGVIICSKKE